MATDPQTGPLGKIALEFGNFRLPVQVLRSAAGYYLGTADDDGPVSRESAEYWTTAAAAEAAFAAGESAWTQRQHP